MITVSRKLVSIGLPLLLATAFAGYAAAEAPLGSITNRNHSTKSTLLKSGVLPGKVAIRARTTAADLSRSAKWEVNLDGFASLKCAPVELENVTIDEMSCSDPGEVSTIEVSSAPGAPVTLKFQAPAGWRISGAYNAEGSAMDNADDSTSLLEVATTAEDEIPCTLTLTATSAKPSASRAATKTVNFTIRPKSSTTSSY